MGFKTRMYEFRKEMNLQQSELAEMVGVRRETIGKLENGKYNPSLKLALDIAKVFGKTVEEVFIFDDTDETDEQSGNCKYLLDNIEYSPHSC